MGYADMKANLAVPTPNLARGRTPLYPSGGEGQGVRGQTAEAVICQHPLNEKIAEIEMV